MKLRKTAPKSEWEWRRLDFRAAVDAEQREGGKETIWAQIRTSACPFTKEDEDLMRGMFAFKKNVEVPPPTEAIVPVAEAAVTNAVYVKPIDDSGREMNLNIKYTSIKFKIDDLYDEIMTLSVDTAHDKTTEAGLEKGIQMDLLPTSEEDVRFKSMIATALNTDPVMMKMSEWTLKTRYRERTMCYLYKKAYPRRIVDVTGQINIVERAIQRVKDDWFKELMCILLAVANYMNSQGGALKPGDAGYVPVEDFGLDGLGRVATVKAFSSDAAKTIPQNAMGYLVSILRSEHTWATKHGNTKYGESLIRNAAAQLPVFVDAKDVKASAITRELTSLNAGYRLLEAELNETTKDNVPTDQERNYITVLTTAFNLAKKEVDALQARWDHQLELYRDLLAYLKQKPDTVPQELFGQVADFCTDLVTTNTQIDKSIATQIENEKKAIDKKRIEAERAAAATKRAMEAGPDKKPLEVEESEVDLTATAASGSSTALVVPTAPTTALEKFYGSLKAPLNQHKIM